METFGRSIIINWPLPSQQVPRSYSFLLAITVHHGAHLIQVLRFSLNICKNKQLLANACFEVRFSGTCISAPHTSSSSRWIHCSCTFPLGSDMVALVMLWPSCLPHIFFPIFQLQEVNVVGNTFLTSLVLNSLAPLQAACREVFQIDSHTIPDPVLFTALHRLASTFVTSWITLCYANTGQVLHNSV